MNVAQHISEEQLNAFIDNALDDKERAQVLEALHHDKALAETVYQMQQDMELLKLVYREPPLPERHPFLTVERPVHRFRALAATILLAGILSGLIVYYLPDSRSPTSSFAELALLDAHNAGSDKILIHLNTMEEHHVRLALDKTEELLHANRDAGEKLQLEFVANAEGLGLLREDSAYADRIRSMTNQHDNVSFLACGIAMENAKLKEGAEVTLLPEAEKIPAALEQILLRLKEGWTYVRG